MNTDIEAARKAFKFVLAERMIAGGSCPIHAEDLAEKLLDTFEHLIRNGIVLTPVLLGSTEHRAIDKLMGLSETVWLGLLNE